MIKLVVEILIPTADNAGAAFPPAHYLPFEAELVARFGGFNLRPGLVRGAWADAGTVYPDSLRCYAVGVDGVLAKSADILAVADFAKAHFAQLAIYVAYLNVAEIL